MVKDNMRKFVIGVIIIAIAIMVIRSALDTSKSNIEEESAQKTGIALGDNDWTLSFAPQPYPLPARNPQDFKKLPELKTIKASVPGNVEIDLLNAKLIDDPMVGDNVFKLRKYEAYQWLYASVFHTPNIEEGQKVFLNLKGVDTLADVFVNGKLVGSPENMFIAHSFDITDLLNHKEPNSLEIILRSPVIEAQKYKPTVGGGRDERAEYMNIRKCPSGFGWDIHPRLVSAGLWKEVSLEIKNQARIDDAFWFTKRVDANAKKAVVVVDYSLALPWKNLDSLIVKSTISKDSKVIATKESPVFSYAGSMEFYLDNVDLWWPKGYGEPSLYDCKIEFIDKNAKKVLDSLSKKVGFRTVKLDFQELDISTIECKVLGNGNVISSANAQKPKGQFKFYINNTPIFVKGTNWVPLDALHSRDELHTKKTIAMAVDLNCNMLRCWGGNVYESDLFYDLCDKNGLMVWQDFALACGVYPQNQQLAEKIRQEVAAVVSRLRSHSSIVLWAGNNENDQAYEWRLKDFNVSPEHDKISRVVIPETILELDWSRPYLPSSPYLSKKTLEQPQKFAPPEAHLWGPRGYYKAEFYTNAIAPFVSEIGYHGCPNRKSLEKMMDKKYVYPWNKDGSWNKQWQAKAVMNYPNTSVCSNRNSLMTNQAKIVFGETPKDLDDFIFASQVVQAEAKKYFIEMWRSQKFDSKTGILWWNLKDAWPILSDAIVDYYYSKKIAYDFIKKAQYDVCAIINDNLEVIVVNDTLKNQSGDIKIVNASDSKLLFEAKYEVSANSKVKLGKISGVNGQGVLLIDYGTNSKNRSKNHYLYGNPPFKLADYKKWFDKIKNN